MSSLSTSPASTNAGNGNGKAPEWDFAITPQTLQSHLAPWAVPYIVGKGREYKEDERVGDNRNRFEIDIGRLLHAPECHGNKTQVYATGTEAGTTTNRDRHSKRVGRLSADIASELGCNAHCADIDGQIHDVGHIPFGHEGGDVLDEWLLSQRKEGGFQFDHHEQGLRILNQVAYRNRLHPGLNLSVEHRDALSSATTGMSMEAQITGFTDDIDYSAYDSQEGIRLGVVKLEQIRACSTLFAEADEWASKKGRRVSGTIIDILKRDLVEATQKNIHDLRIKTIGDVYDVSEPIVVLSEEREADLKQLKSFLMPAMWSPPSKREIFIPAARELIHGICDYLLDNQDGTTAYCEAMARQAGDAQPKTRAVVDRLSIMTDAEAIRFGEMIGISTDVLDRINGVFNY